MKKIKVLQVIPKFGITDGISALFDELLLAL